MEKLVLNGQEYQPARRFPRFNANHRALVVLEGDVDHLPHHVVQIGEGGLSFRYLGQKIKPGELKSLSLYLEDQLIVESVPVQPVSDYRLEGNLVPVRCMCVSFQEMTAEQKRDLDEFIKHYTSP